MNNNPTHFVIDVDGVLSTGQFIYGDSGKLYKIFGPHDSDGLKLIKEKVNVSFISADKRGFEISNKRVSDMGFKLDLVSEEDRRNHLEKLGFENVIFMGDGYYDALLFSEVNYSIAPANARKEALENADYVTENKAGEGAVMDACIHLNEMFYIN
mgnify:CR=1 FL=1|tara:strand:- start:667 stop:1131 length:465 start_codon:yes stop_codon:yes gene_type:complete